MEVPTYAWRQACIITPCATEGTVHFAREHTAADNLGSLLCFPHCCCVSSIPWQWQHTTEIDIHGHRYPASFPAMMSSFAG